MKKNYLAIFIPLCLVALALAACGPTTGEVDQYLAANNTEATEIENFTAGTTVARTNYSVNALAITAGSVPDTMRCAVEQRFELDFNYELDPATIDAGVRFFPLQTATNGYTLSVRGNPMPFTRVIEPINGGGSKVIFTVNLTTASATSEFFIDASVLAGVNGQKLDLDGDEVLGEDSDDYIDTFTVLPSSATTPVNPSPITLAVVGSPRAQVNFGLAGLLASNAVINMDTYNTDDANRFRFTLSDTGSSATPTLVSFAGAVQGFEFLNGAWAPITLNTTYDGPTTTATIQLPTGAPARAHTYKIVIDQYNLIETSAVLGYTHRRIYDEKDAGRYVTRYFNFCKPGGAQQDMTVTANPADSANYLDFVIAGTPIDLATVNSANFKIMLTADTVLSSGSDAGTGFFVNIAASDIIIMESSIFDNKDNMVNHFKIRLPTWIKELDGSSGNNAIIISPNVLSVDNAAQNGVGLRSFGDVDGVDGWRVIFF